MKLCPTCGQQWPDDQKFCPNDGSALRTAGSRDLVGCVIAERYHIQKKLGEGGMGAVYLGEHVKMGRKSAIKVGLDPTNTPSQTAVTGDTAQRVARRNHTAPPTGTATDRTSQREQTAHRAGGSTAPTSTSAPPRPKVDSAAIDRELGAGIDPIGDPAADALVRQRGQAYYDNPDVPVNVRTSAAFTIAQTYVVEQQLDQVCSWSNLALRLAPSNATYQKLARERCP